MNNKRKMEKKKEEFSFWFNRTMNGHRKSCPKHGEGSLTCNELFALH
jgi:hypothetical protein